MVQKVSQARFQEEVLEAEVPVLVDFYADWCGPCRGLAPLLEELASEADTRYKVVKVDTDTERDLAMHYGVSALPTIKIFSDGQLVHTVVGTQGKARLQQLLGVA